MLPVTPNHGVRFDRALWQAYVSANKIFADKIMEVINPDEDYVWVHDYHLMILPVGIHMSRLESFMAFPDTAKKVQELRDKFEGKIVMLGVDDMDMFKGISLKFLALGQLLEDHPDLRGRVVLVQIVNPARSQGKDVQEVQNEIDKVANEVNKKYGKLGYKPIVSVSGPVSTQDKVAHYAISECCVVNAVRDGMNLVPYKYTVCRQGSPDLDKALGLDWYAMQRKSVILVSEFIGFSPSLSGAIRVNPWNIDAVADAMNLAISMPEAEKDRCSIYTFTPREINLCF
ncbi:hypothetical protein F0562_010927 [Nyssa sinensis]|uniref:Uncharacterized protein n=1 Tax=Nyssa sinensis TaxID=561372 RepID=A0A5J5A2R8_9ASTE|nr:hypothetical protein F0562_010927 [Nyssa sinensis]